MSLSLSQILTGYTKYKLSLEEAESILETDPREEEILVLENEAKELIDQYNQNLDKLENYLDEPYQTAFTATMLLTPRSFERLAYTEKLKEHNHSTGKFND